MECSSLRWLLQNWLRCLRRVLLVSPSRDLSNDPSINPSNDRCIDPCIDAFIDPPTDTPYGARSLSHTAHPSPSLTPSPKHKSQQTQKFVDVAGNIYDVLTDSLGQATKFVVSSTGAILDSTKIAGGFFLDSLASYPSDVKAGIQESMEDSRKYMAAGSDMLGQLGKIAQDARPTLPSFKDMLNPGAWKDAAAQSSKNMVGAFGQLENQVMDIYTDIEAEFCTPAKLEPSKKKPTEITMPGFIFEVGLGSCTVANTNWNASALEHGDAFNCTKPYAGFQHTPGKFVAKHHTPIKFVGKDCKKEVVFGEDEEITLFEFNGHDALDLDRVRNTISGALGGLSNAGSSLTNQVQSFVAGMKKVPDNMMAKLSGLAELSKYGQMPASYPAF